ncbi:aspartic peptidase domain-containing protein [Boletus edulis BED1]|uniref:Aspartic peptidase domain-containing protein n=1 Tax=Boletus edulis BED1 TaxID=1328754 RepID=A0AAD4CB15_BOLED|nr:aspartic peptidase domain-containing protein [Boletus edulis BED1]
MYFPTITLLSSLLLSSGFVHASPLSRDTGKASLTISIKINTVGVGQLVEKERARIQSLKYATHDSSGRGSFNVSNYGVFYTAEVGVGTPPTYHTLLVDTGSSNTWVWASQPYVATNSSVNTGNSVSVTYGSGAFYGEEWLDTVTFTPDLVIDQQSIVVASRVAGLNAFDGILGLGSVDQTHNSVNNTFEVPTVTDNLYAQRKISQQVLGVFFSPASDSEHDNSGELVFGGYDKSVMTSPVRYVPLTTTTPAAYYWGINQSIYYGKIMVLSSTAGIVDTGSTLIYIASDAFQRYQSLTGATLDPITGLLTITSAQYANLQTLTFNIGGTSYGLTPNAQIWPRSLNAAMGLNTSAIYLVINDIGSGSGSGFDFVNGYSFLQRFYSVFDTTNQRVGFAETVHTKSNSN